MNYIRNNTEALKGIDESKIKQIEADYDNNVFVLLEDGSLYKDGEKLDSNISQIYMFDGLRLYKITKDNKIQPIDDTKQCDDIDRYMNNNNTSYKKIITSTMQIVALTEEGNIKTINNYFGLGVIPENFSNVEDISIVKQNEYEEIIYIYKDKEKRVNI